MPPPGAAGVVGVAEVGVVGLAGVPGVAAAPPVGAAGAARVVGVHAPALTTPVVLPSQLLPAAAAAVPAADPMAPTLKVPLFATTTALSSVKPGWVRLVAPLA